MKNLLTTLVALVAILIFPVHAQSQMKDKCNVYQFKYPIMLPATPVKNQAVTGTCWSFATTSFFESELMRMGKGVYELSEMFTVRYNYINRVNNNFIKQGKGKEYTTISFFQSLGINTEDYLLLTSFLHHPFYSNFVLEIPDNWNGGRYHNLPLDEFMQVIDNALQTGYTICWDGDMSKKNYSDPIGIAVMPTEQELNSEPNQKLMETRNQSFWRVQPSLYRVCQSKNYLHNGSQKCNPASNT